MTGTVALALARGMRIVIVDKQRHRVGQDVDDGTDGLDTALRRARRIHDQAGAECAGNAATEAAERVDLRDAI